MRDLTCGSYASLIVDTRNITGRHRTGNAWGSPLETVVPMIRRLLNLSGLDLIAGAGLAKTLRRGNIDPFSAHTGGRP